MSESTARPRRIIGFSLSPDLAAKVKAEAKRREISLKTLFEEIWQLYESAGKPPKKR